MNNTKHDPEACYEAMKLALQRPIQLSREETLEFITKPIYMGMPHTQPYSGKGPRPKLTQYDDAYDRRKGLYHRLARLPSLRRGKGYAENTIRNVANKLAPSYKSKQRQFVAAIIRELELSGEPAPNEKTVRGVLCKLGYRN